MPASIEFEFGRNLFSSVDTYGWAHMLTLAFFVENRMGHCIRCLMLIVMLMFHHAVDRMTRNQHHNKCPFDSGIKWMDIGHYILCSVFG